MSIVGRRGKISARAMSKYIKGYNKKAQEPDYEEKYVYLPLHYQPENTTCPLAGSFVDQQLIVNLLSYCLPEGVFLYVKEHPKQTAVGRTKDYYEKLLGRKNVRLIRTDANSFALMDHAV